jgi:peptidoglycan/xylan/chitin deacetylase (PgdA/CDA1 family)
MGACVQYASAAGSRVLLVHDASREASVLDCRGIAEAYDEEGIATIRTAYETDTLAASLSGVQLVVACDVTFNQADAIQLEQWVKRGGGLMATGRAAFGLESLLGLQTVYPQASSDVDKVRFVTQHPAAYGSYWSGPMMEAAIMPATHQAPVAELFYRDRQWPAFVAEPGVGQVLARWAGVGPDPTMFGAAIVAHQYGAGRTLYSGALLGAYANWEWPYSWRTVVASASQWLSEGRPWVSLGYWPNAHVAAFSWTGDTETHSMPTAVPAILAVFERLGLARFGTFYVTADGDAPGQGFYAGAQQYPDVIERIVEAGSEVAGHGDFHRAFAGESLATQRARISGMLVTLNGLLSAYGERVRGFRAPFLSQDFTTFQALTDMGLEYDSGDADVWVASTLPNDSDGIWQLPPTMPMDWHLFVEHDVSSRDATTIFLDKLEYVVARRGLFSWLHHPWVIEPELDVLQSVLAYAVERGDLWMARQDDILDWWIAREQLSPIEVETVGAELRIRLANVSATRAVAGASVWLSIPQSVVSPPEFSIDGQPNTPIIREHAGALFAVVVLPALAPQQSVSITMTLGQGIFADDFAN